jgi:predicted nucleic acid-binding Zn ribbon protein
MSSEQSLSTETHQSESIKFKDNKKDIPKKIQTRVNINSLLVKLREKEKLQKNESLLFFGIVSLIVITILIIVSL